MWKLYSRGCCIPRIFKPNMSVFLSRILLYSYRVIFLNDSWGDCSIPKNHKQKPIQTQITLDLLKIEDQFPITTYFQDEIWSLEEQDATNGGPIKCKAEFRTMEIRIYELIQLKIIVMTLKIKGSNLMLLLCCDNRTILSIVGSRQ